jgi:hypothetical protein
LAAAVAVLLAATACSDPQSPKLGADLLPQTYPLTVTVTTTGSDIGPNGYAVWVNESQSQHVGVNGVVTFTVPAGLNVVALYGVPSNCTVSGYDPRWVPDRDGLVEATVFSVSCVSYGGLFVSNNTTGVDLPATGYTVTVDGGASQAIATNGSVTFTKLAAGGHSVALSGVAANCAVSGPNPQTVTVRSGATVSAPFSLTCAPTGSGSGSLTVTTTTTGSNPPPNGYTVTIDGTFSQPIATNGSVTYTGPAGNHPVALSGVTANCTVSGANPRTVTVPAGGAGTATFSVTCSAQLPPAEVIGQGQIGMGAATPRNEVRTFDFDVRADLTGRFKITDYTDIRPNGSAAWLITDASRDPTTSITAYRSSSTACSDPSRGVEFDAVGRDDQGALEGYTVQVCDNGPAGSGTDFWSIFVAQGYGQPVAGYGHSGIVTSGDIVKR